jgi:hypothetical protein
MSRLRVDLEEDIAPPPKFLKVADRMRRWNARKRLDKAHGVDRPVLKQSVIEWSAQRRQRTAPGLHKRTLEDM